MTGGHKLIWGTRCGALAVMVAALLLAACEKEVVLEGPRFPVRTPIDQTLTPEGTPLEAPPEVQPNAAPPISLPRASALAEWSHRAGNAAHSLPHGRLSDAPQRVWSVKIGAGNTRGQRIAASPVAAGGRIFAMDTGQTVAAVTPDGALLWSANLAPEFDPSADVSGGGLAVAGAVLFVSTGAGEVLALAVDSGAVLWRQRLDGPISGPPTAAGGQVYVLQRSGTATALNAKTGRILWQREGAPRKGGMLGAGAIAAEGGRLYLPYAGGLLEAVQAQDGAPIWQAGTAGQRLGRASSSFGDVTGDPVVRGGVVYLGTAAGITAAISASTGQRIWTATEGALNAPLVVGGSVFVVNDAARLVRLDADTGQVIWGQQMPYFRAEKPRRFKAITAHYGPLLAGGRLVVASGDGTLRLFDAASGAVLGQGDIPSGAASAPALVGDMLVVMGANGQLHAFR